MLGVFLVRLRPLFRVLPRRVHARSTISFSLSSNLEKIFGGTAAIATPSTDKSHSCSCSCFFVRKWQASKDSASLPVDASDAESAERVVDDSNGSTRDMSTARDSPAVRDAQTQVASAEGMDGVKAGSGSSSSGKKAIPESPR